MYKHKTTKRKRKKSRKKLTKKCGGGSPSVSVFGSAFSQPVESSLSLSRREATADRQAIMARRREEEKLRKVEEQRRETAAAEERARNRASKKAAKVDSDGFQLVRSRRRKQHRWQGNQGQAWGNQGQAWGNQGQAWGNQGQAWGNQGQAWGNQGQAWGNQGQAWGNQQRSQNFHQNRGSIAYKYWKELFEKPLEALAGGLSLEGRGLSPSDREHQIYHAVNQLYLQIFKANRIFGGFDYELRKMVADRYYKPVWSFTILLDFYKKRLEQGIPISMRVKQRLLALAENYRFASEYINPDLRDFLNTHIIQAGLPKDNDITDAEDKELAQKLVESF